MNPLGEEPWVVDAVDEPIEVLLVGGEEGVGDDLVAAFPPRASVTVTAVATVDDAASSLERVDCLVCANPNLVSSACSCLEVLRDADATLPFISFAPIEDVDVIRDALDEGVTDVVPTGGENAYSVLADRIMRAVDAARAMTRANEQAAELRAERDRFAALFENIPEPTIFYELDGKDPVTIDVNPAFESVFGYDAETVRGDVVDDYIVPEDKASEATDLNERIADGEHLDTEVRRSTADGERDFLLRDVPLQEGDTMRGYAIYTDITPQREREARLRETTNRLEEQNERLEAFTGVVSHDLRNPLSVATTYTELLQDRYEDEDDLDTVRDALDRMDDLIQDLLALAQQGTDAQNRRLVEIDMVAGEAWSAVETADATLSVSTDGAALRADEGRLRQLFENLFANSLEHGTESDDDSITVTVGVIDDDETQGFYVSDDGRGIPEADREHVFEEGYTGEDGTGFGLAIVNAVVEAHDWDVAVETGEAGGARFEITDVDIVA